MDSQEHISWSADIPGRVYMLRAQEVIGPMRSLFHSIDTSIKPYFKAGKLANFYLKLTVDYRKGDPGSPNTYDGLPLVLDESLKENEVQFIGDSIYSLFILNIRSVDD